MIVSMISVEFGEYRFFSGDNVTYTDSSYSYLLEQAAAADTPEMRRYAAAGILRGLLDLPAMERHDQEFFDAVNWGRDVVLDVLKEEAPTEPSPATKSFIDTLPSVNGVFDATSIAATNAAIRQNNPLTTRAAIEKRSPVDRPKLFIALGHGGIVSSLATFAEMPEDTLVYPVRFSRHKAKDGKPCLSNRELELLQTYSVDRDVIVHDEDRSSSGTIRTATSYFRSLLLRPTYGVTPATGRHPNGYEPEVVWYDDQDRANIDTYGVWSDKLADLRATVDQPVA